MAQKIQAIATYGPRLKLMEAADQDRFMNLITNRPTLSSGVVKNVQESEVETLIGLLLEGRPVLLPARSPTAKILTRLAMIWSRFGMKITLATRYRKALIDFGSLAEF